MPPPPFSAQNIHKKVWKKPKILYKHTKMKSMSERIKKDLN